jgi:hypothetical protein
MATIKSKTHKGLSLNVQYDYITLKTPNGNFTRSRYGSKSTGKMAAHPTAFRSIDNFIDNENSTTLQASMERLLDPKTISKLFPEFDEEVPQFSVGDTARYTGGHKEFAGLVGEVKKVKIKNVFILFPGRTSAIGFDKSFVEKV